jgi:hypothetical protein
MQLKLNFVSNKNQISFFFFVVIKKDDSKTTTKMTLDIN